MTISYLFDTNIISDLVKNPAGNVANKIVQVGEDNIFTSVIVACELRFGARKKGSKRLQDNLDQILEALMILPLEPSVANHYARIRADLEQVGNLIGPNDLLIAAHALAEGCTLVTGNIREFSRIPELSVENWLSESSSNP